MATIDDEMLAGLDPSLLADIKGLLTNTEVVKEQLTLERRSEASDAAAKEKEKKRSRRAADNSIDQPSIALTIGVPNNSGNDSNKGSDSAPSAEVRIDSAKNATAAAASSATRPLAAMPAPPTAAATERRKSLGEDLSERKRERSSRDDSRYDSEEEQKEQLKALARQRDELRKQRERIEAEQYTNYQSAKDRHGVEETTYLLRENEVSPWSCWQGIVGMCGRNGVIPNGFDMIKQAFQPS